MSDGVNRQGWSHAAWPLATLVLAGGLVALSVRAEGLDAQIEAAEKKRVAVIEKVKPAVVAIFANGGQGGGSGVLIDQDGYALTNFHVVSGSGPVMKCGLPDGFLYDAVLVGLDKVGDVALIKLLPRKEGAKFPFATMGDSDTVKAGDWSLAMGNPFLLATDFTPTVTFGLVSGVHRYQYPAGTLLEYTDCIQIDTSINPGNSGGPLFNLEGELIGINGRGSFEKRGRVNSGVGYAISINQIKNFLGQLRVGMDTDHASVGALVESESEEGALSKVIIKTMIRSDAERRGLDVGDQVEEFAGRRIFTVNQFKNVLGLFPRGWRVPLTYRRENEKKQTEKKQVLVRLMGVQRQEIGDGEEAKPQPGTHPPGPAPKTPASKLYEPKPGFANYYFNKLEQDHLLAAFQKQGDFQSRKGLWNIRTSGTLYAGNGTRGKPMVATFTIKPKAAEKGEGDLVQAIIDGVDYSVEPLNGEKSDLWRDPRASGGLLMALHQWRQMLAFGRQGFVGSNVSFSHGGIEPFYPPAMGQTDVDYSKLRVDTEVLRTRYATADCKWYFSLKNDDTRVQLLGFEMFLDRDEDPCEIYFSDYREVSGGKLPHHIEIVYGDKKYASLNVTAYRLEEAKKP